LSTCAYILAINGTDNDDDDDDDDDDALIFVKRIREKRTKKAILNSIWLVFT
jgi:hypothetical protein